MNSLLGMDRKRSGGPDLKMDASDITSDGCVSEMGGNFVHTGKKRRIKKSTKSGSQERKDGLAVEVADVDGESTMFEEDIKKPKTKRGKAKAKIGGGMEPSVLLEEMKGIRSALEVVITADDFKRSHQRVILSHIAEYERLVNSLIAEKELLRGRLEERSYKNAQTPLIDSAAAGALPAASSTINVVPSVTTQYPPLIPKPVDTWSVVVKGKKGVSSKEVLDKVKKEVGPTLGVRVHDIVATKNGGAVIRTPSVAERKKIAANAKFSELGLEVSVSDKLGPRIVVQGVSAGLDVEKFMNELYEKNLKKHMSREEFEKSVRIISKPWEVKADLEVNVVLEVSSKVMELLAGGAYLLWFRCRVRQQDPVRSCYRCLGFDHEVRNCRNEETTCRRCGMNGHLASSCKNDIRCRDCAYRGRPAGHMMLSSSCPLIAARVAVANSRH